MANQIQHLESRLQTLPEGHLICARNGTRFKWYQSINRIPNYLPKKERETAEQLAEKKYISLELEYLRNELKALDSYLQIHNSVSDDANLLFHAPGYDELLSSAFNAYTRDYHTWMNTSYEHNPNHTEQLTHRTISGHIVRSKSEAMIDYALYMNHIPFRYECALTLGDITIYPDFTIKHPQTGKTYYWEHFGMMDEPAYYKSVYSKLQLYTSHKIIPTIQLITTFETKEHPLNSETVDNIIKHYFC